MGKTEPTPTIVLIFNSPFIGGIEAHGLGLAEGLTRRGFEVASVCPAHVETAPWRESLAKSGAVHLLDPYSGGSMGLLERFRTLVSIFRSHRPFICHFHFNQTGGGFLTALAAKVAGARAIVWTEHQDVDPQFGRKEAWLVRIRDLLLDRIICVSSGNLEGHARLIGRSRRKMTSIPNGIDLRDFDPARVDGSALRARLGVAADGVLVGTLSRLNEEKKGARLFVQMAQRLLAEGLNAKFVVVGEGRLRPELEALAGDAVTFLGRYPDAAECYAAMDVFVMPSSSEGGPITVLEAMAMNCALVSTPVGVVPEVVTDEVNGLIVEPQDVDALTSAVRRLVADPGTRRRLRQAARDVIETCWSTDAMVEAVAGVYKDCAPWEA